MRWVLNPKTDIAFNTQHDNNVNNHLSIQQQLPYNVFLQDIFVTQGIDIEEKY